MWIRVLSALYALLAFSLFMRFPNLDSLILALSALMPLAVWSEEIWEKFKDPSLTTGPLCPNCGYDVRATPIRCPECGRSLDPSISQWPEFSEGAVYQSLTSLGNTILSRDVDTLAKDRSRSL